MPDETQSPKHDFAANSLGGRNNDATTSIHKREAVIGAGASSSEKGKVISEKVGATEASAVEVKKPGGMKGVLIGGGIVVLSTICGALGVEAPTEALQSLAYVVVAHWEVLAGIGGLIVAAVSGFKLKPKK